MILRYIVKTNSHLVCKVLKNFTHKIRLVLGGIYLEGSELGLSLEDDEDSFVVPYSFLWRESETE